MRVERLEEIVSRAERDHGSRTRYNAWLHRLRVQLNTTTDDPNGSVSSNLWRSELDMLVRAAHGPNVDESEANALTRLLVTKHDQSLPSGYRDGTGFYSRHRLGQIIRDLMVSSHWTHAPDGPEKPHTTRLGLL